MRIAVIGTRGIPANYGGFETLAEQLSVRLAGRGHEVTVYCRRAYARHPHGYIHKGVILAVLPTIRHKYLDTVVHALLSTFHALPKRYDVILVCNAANTPVTFFPRLFGTPVVINVDGLERKRKKWNALGRAWYRLSERLSTILPSAIITDAITIAAYYAERYGKTSTFIPYGADTGTEEGTETLEQFGLQSNGYMLYVSRLEPENNADLVVRAFEQVKTDRRLVIVGDAPYAGDYISRLKATADPRVVFTGAVFGRGYRQLQSGAYCYVQATEVGGTHPALVEAMGFGNCVAAADVPEHREVLGESGFYFPLDNPAGLTATLQQFEDQPQLVADTGRANARRSAERYSWDVVTDGYEQLFNRLTGKKI
jgi:glycosyltransferase involved in cell wall biosynthesis